MMVRWIASGLLLGLVGAVFGSPVHGQDPEAWAEQNRRIKVASADPVFPAPKVAVVRVDRSSRDLFLPYGREIQRLTADPTWRVVELPTLFRSEGSIQSLVGVSGIVEAYPIVEVPYVRDAFVPNDPYFQVDNPAAGWPGQWYLKNAEAVSIRAEGAWNLDYEGTGILLGVIDDGVQANHPDLFSNYQSINSFDFGQNDGNPSPVTAADNHGTAVAGIMVARGGNGIGITGVAPNARFGALRLDFNNAAGFPTQDIDATLYRSSGSTVVIRIKNHSYGPIAPYSPSTAQAAAIVTSTTAGTIHVRSAGNARGTSGEDVSKFLERSIPESIVVGAVGSDGTFASYSSFGASLTCVAPSSPNLASFRRMLTTDRTTEAAGYNGSGDSFPDADYTANFGFTSGAAPLVSGGLALVRQAAPTLNTRFAKHLIARTATKIHPNDASAASDGGWRNSTGGIQFNPNYGFGLINIEAMIGALDNYSGVTPLTTEVVPTTTVGATVPDNNTTGLSRTFNLTSTAKLEEMLVTLNITHTFRGDLEAYLTSPTGTRRRLFIQSGGDGGDNINWTFVANGFWGENPAGTWTLDVRDIASADVGTWNSFAVDARMGDLIPRTTRISGLVTLESYFPTPDTQSITFELLDSNGVAVETQTLTPTISGDYEFVSNLTSGTYKLAAKGRHWLRRASADVVLNGGSIVGVDFSLINGDVDNDNAVTIFDYIELSTNFDKSSADSDWNVSNGSGVKPSDSDLDGDDSVSIFDYIVLSSEFDKSGD